MTNKETNIVPKVTNNSWPTDAIKQRIARYQTEKESLAIELERDIIESQERGDQNTSYREDQDYLRHEIYRLETVIEALEELLD
jgi:hypothetical protein